MENEFNPFVSVYPQSRYSSECYRNPILCFSVESVQEKIHPIFCRNRIVRRWWVEDVFWIGFQAPWVTSTMWYQMHDVLTGDRKSDTTWPPGSSWSRSKQTTPHPVCPSGISATCWEDKNWFYLFIFSLCRATPTAYGTSQARGRIEAIAASLHHSSWQHWIFNPLSEASDQTCILMDASQICFCWAMVGTAGFFVFFKCALQNVISSSAWWEFAHVCTHVSLCTLSWACFFPPWCGWEGFYIVLIFGENFFFLFFFLGPHLWHM